MKTITICSSVNFYRQAIDIQTQLSSIGFEVLLPATAEMMKQSGDYDVSHYKTWFGDASDYRKKTELMNKHFAKITQGDAILVLNYEKNGQQNYIGGNVLMEMAVAFYLKKRIFVLNELPLNSAYLEEIIGMNPVILHGDISDLKP